MAAAASPATAFLATPSARAASAAASATNWGPDSLEVRGLKSKLPMSSSGRMQVNAIAQATPTINGTKVALKTGSPKTEDDSLPSASCDESPDWSTILAGITSLYLAAEKQRTLLDRRPNQADASDIGRLIHDGKIFRQKFSIRSYEVDADQTASVATLLNHLQVTSPDPSGRHVLVFSLQYKLNFETSFLYLFQETSLNHARVAGVLNDGFGATPEMSRRGLIWVVAKMKIVVEQYPSW